MQAKKCDRCEKFYEPYKPKVDTYKSNMLIFAEDAGPTIGYYENRQFELCPKCMFEAVKFMQEKLPNIE